MNLARRSLFACACCAGVLGRTRLSVCAPDAAWPQMLELGKADMTRIGHSVWVARIAPGVWLYSCTAAITGGTVYPANGLVIERKQGSVLIDTGYHPDQAEILLAWSRRTIPPIVLGVATHFHFDRTGGIPALRAAGIAVVAHPLSCALAAAHGLPVPDALDEFRGESYAICPELELFYPGAAHTRDNIVAWMPAARVLFGGCMVKSVTSDDLGYTDDAVLADWPASLRHVRDRYPSPFCVVPGHGTIAGDPLGVTLSLLAKA